MNEAAIVGIGRAIPQYSIAQAGSVAAAKLFVHGREDVLRVLPALYRMTRVSRRGSVVLEGPSEQEACQSFYPPAASDDDRGPATSSRMRHFGKAASRLAIEAAQEALRDASKLAEQITHLVTVTCTGFQAPGIDIDLIEQLQLSPDTQRVQVGFMGCHAIINGLRVAGAIAKSQPGAVVLVVSVELCSLHYQYGNDPDQIVSNAIFADGAGALVVCHRHAESDPLAGGMQLVATGSRWIPGSRDCMTWKIGDHGFQMTLAASVPQTIESNLLGYITEWLAEQRLTIDDISGWAVHPGGPRVLTAVEQSLSLPKAALEVSRDVLAEHGNMSSATLVFILAEMRQRKVDYPWLMMGFGPGLEIELALLN